MSEARVDPTHYPIRMEGSYRDDSVFPIAATVEEGINFLTRTDIEFVSSNRALELGKFVGREMRLVVQMPGGRSRVFPGVCVALEYLGTISGPGHYRAEVRPWLWFLNRARNSRIFQNLSVPAILRKVLGEFGFSGDIEDRLTGTYPERDYVVQYRETSLDFLNRLMEEEGIYYFFREQDGREKLVVADSASAHEPAPGESRLPFRSIDSATRRQIEHISELISGESVTSGKVSLEDYDFERPRADLMVSSAIPRGGHAQKDHLIYDYPGHFRERTVGERRARVRMEAEAARHKTVTGAGTVSNLGPGMTFELVDHPRSAENAGFMVTRAVHSLSTAGAASPPLGVTSTLGLQSAVGAESYLVRFQAIPKAEQYRAPLATPWPEIAGVHTAVVVGPAGEEIFPDKYGRVKVQFHWDRDGCLDEYASCWIRTMMPWTGRNWGMISVPRIGQEVVVQFEEGNPDRPLIVGMLYNVDTMPPFGFPDHKTQSGLVTRSTKGGNADTFHELMFEDAKGSELVRFQSERDYRQIVKNNAEVTVGLEHKDLGDMSLTIHRNLTETLKTGDHSFSIETGGQTIAIKTDKSETIKGKSTLVVTGDVSETVDQGNRTEKIKTGNVTRSLSMGNETTTLDRGNYKLDASLGSISNSAMQKIELKVGANSLTIDQSGVTIKGLMVKIEATAMLEAKAPMSTVKGDALLILKGGLTMIN